MFNCYVFDLFLNISKIIDPILFMIFIALIMVQLGGAVGQNLNSMLISDVDTVYERTVCFLTGLRCLMYSLSFSEKKIRNMFA